jgi:SAM-dependent methyltransferase
MIRQDVKPGPAADVAALPGEKSCPACGSAQRTDFFEADGLPVHVGVFFDTPEKARRTPRGDVILAYCHACGLVYNRLFDRRKVSYEPGYEVALHHSPVFREFMEGVAARLIERFDIRGKHVLEIGCGCGYFLRMLCRLGANHGVGIDPTVDRERTEQAGEGRVRLIRDFFTESHAELPADFICCLSVFEHVPDPLAFLRMLRRMVGQRRPGIYFEMFNAFEAFRNEETWSIHYEQCNYFSKDSLAGAFVRSGFDVMEADTCYEDGEYIYVDAVPNPDFTAAADPPAASHTELPKEISGFSAAHQRKMQTWRDRLEAFGREDRRVVFWGAAGKGISFLNLLDTTPGISYVVDINPDKHGKYVPGSAQQIMAPEFIAEYQPDTIIISNPLYLQEISRQACSLGVSCDVLVA